MLYPAYTHPGDIEHAFGVLLPDFPGCFSAALQEQDIASNVQEAVEAHFSDEDRMPPPSKLESFRGDPSFQGEFRRLIDIDLTWATTRAS